MGDPRKQRKKFSGPQHPWNKARIDEEKVLLTTYGLKNKKGTITHSIRNK